MILWVFVETGIFLKTHTMCQCYTWISLWAQRWPMLDAEAITPLDRSPIPRQLLRPRGQGFNVIYHHTLLFCKPTSLSVITKRIKDEPWSPASSLLHAQQVNATKHAVYLGPSTPKLHLCQGLPGSWRLSPWDPCTGHYPPRPHGGLHFDHLPRAPGDQRMVTATWSWQAYWLMVMFWASAITCFPTGFK